MNFDFLQNCFLDRFLLDHLSFFHDLGYTRLEVGLLPLNISECQLCLFEMLV
jgi:hypothetical protein